VKNNKRRGVVAGTVIAAVFGVQTFAHGGINHVMGAVVKVENNVLTVKAAKGDVDVKLTGKTELTQGKKAEIAELKPSARVIVDVPEGGKDFTAHMVKIGVVAATDHVHDTHR